MSKTSEKITELESEISRLNSEKQSYQQELSILLENLKGKKAKKADLQQEVELRKKIEEINEEISSKEKELSSLKKDGKGTKTIVTISSIIIVLILIATAYIAIKTKNCASKEEADKTAIETSIFKKALAAKSGVASVLVDVTNDEQVKRAAENILNEDVNPIIEAEKDPSYTALATRENIEDIIRVFNGELPKYRNYYKYTVQDVANTFDQIFCNMGNVGNVRYDVQISRLFPDGSAEAEFVKPYGEIYNKIRQYEREGNVDGFVQETGKLTKKFVDEIIYGGLNGGPSIWNLPKRSQFGAIEAILAPYPNVVEEYKKSNCILVYVDGCWDSEKQEYKQYETSDVFEAICMGMSVNGEVVVRREVIAGMNQDGKYNEVFCIYTSLRETAEELLKSKYYDDVNVKKIG